MIQNNKQQEVPLTYCQNPYINLINQPYNLQVIQQPPIAPNQVVDQLSQTVGVQVSFLVKVLLLYILWSFLFFFGYLYLSLIFSFSNLSEYYPILIPLLIFSGLMILAILKYGTIQESRNCCVSLLFFLCLIIAQTCFIALLATFLVSLMPNVDERKIIGYVFFVECFGNGISTVIILVHLLTISKNYGYECPIAVQMIFLIPLAVFQPGLLPYVALSFLYSVLLIRAMKQIQQGKYNLKDHEVITGALAIYSQILTPW